MKRVALMSIIMLAFACQKKEENGYRITADTIGFDDGTPVYVNTVNKSNRPVIIDSTVIKGNTFEISLPPAEERDFHFLSFKDIQGNVLYLGENNPIQMTIYKDSLRSSKVIGGEENKLFFEYINTMKKFGKRRQDVSKILKEASVANNAENMNQNSQRMSALQAEERAYRKNIAEKNPNSLVAVMSLSDMMTMKMLPAKEIKKLYDPVADILKKSRLGENLNSMLTEAASVVDIGGTVDDFSAPTPDGSTLSLKKAMGKVTIIDFWASWCKPCRMENPNVVRVYNKYHDKGLNIIGVSLDKSKEKWEQAIAQDKLEWDHVSNLKFWQEPIARSFGVRSIPATFILDENGSVVAKNLRGVELETKIKEMLENPETL